MSGQIKIGTYKLTGREAGHFHQRKNVGVRGKLVKPRTAQRQRV